MEGRVSLPIPEISLDPRDFPRASPSGNLLGLGKFSGGDGFPNTSLVLVEHGYNAESDDGIAEDGTYQSCSISSFPLKRLLPKSIKVLDSANLNAL